MVPKASVVNIFDDNVENHSVSPKKTLKKKIFNSVEGNSYQSTFFNGNTTENELTYTKISNDLLQNHENQSDSEQFFVQIKSSSENNATMDRPTAYEAQVAESAFCDDVDDNDETKLLPKTSSDESGLPTGLFRRSSSTASTAGNPSSKKESAKDICLQTIFPFIMAGFGMVAVGIVLDNVQHWDVFLSIPEIFILVPALLGLKGNLEMTLASRLSTYANRGQLDDKATRWSIVWGNMVVVEAQAMVVAFLASLVAMILGWIPDGTWENEHAIMLCTGSLLTGAIASGLLGFVMIIVVILSTKCGINPDNVATPIAAALGDLITLLLLSAIVRGLYSVLHQSSTAWVGPVIICIFMVLTPLFLYLSHRNPFTKDVIKHGWIPVIAAMGISSLGGLILDYGVSKNPGIAVFVPIINGVGGNLAAVQASRISTYLHTSGSPIGTLPDKEKSGCLSPCYTFCSSSNVHSVGARVMLFMVVPGQIFFVLIIQILQAGHTSITPQFVAVYLLMSLIQVAVLIQICNWMVLRLWKSEVDPDNSAIPYMTGLGDLLGTALLAAGFWFLWLVGDRDMDVGD